MSGEALYERYKDALKRGHVASLRGRLEEALMAYGEAAAIAPERSTPHTSAGTALLRRKQPADALRSFSMALALAPHDEPALLGRAQALAAMGRRSDAADAYDALAEVRATSGKLADAVDAARRGLELAEGRERRRILERLIERLRASEPGEPGRLALERALRILEGPAVRPSTAGVPDPAADAAGRGPSVVPGATATPAPVAREAGGAADRGGPERTGDGVPAEGSAETTAPDEGPSPSPVAAVRAALDRDLPPDIDVAALSRATEEAVARSDDAGLGLLLDLAAVHRRDGRIDAALDACYLALSVRPDDVDVHLGLVELYDARGWGVLAAEKLDLLDRLAALDEDAETANRVAAARGGRA